MPTCSAPTSLFPHRLHARPPARLPALQRAEEAQQVFNLFITRVSYNSAAIGMNLTRPSCQERAPQHRCSGHGQLRSEFAFTQPFTGASFCCAIRSRSCSATSWLCSAQVWQGLGRCHRFQSRYICCWMPVWTKFALYRFKRHTIETAYVPAPALSQSREFKLLSPDGGRLRCSVGKQYENWQRCSDPCHWTRAVRLSSRSCSNASVTRGSRLLPMK